jgi:hypothetical protein
LASAPCEDLFPHAPDRIDPKEPLVSAFSTFELVPDHCAGHVRHAPAFLISDPS